MSLKQSTWEILRNVRSIHQRHGFQTDEQLRSFWQKFGPNGFLNIREITADMVREIRTEVIEKQEGGRA